MIIYVISSSLTVDYDLPSFHSAHFLYIIPHINEKAQLSPSFSDMLNTLQVKTECFFVILELLNVNSAVVVVADNVEAVDRNKVDEEQNDRAIGRLGLNTASLSDCNLLLSELVLPVKGVYTTCNTSKQNCLNEAGDLGYAAVTSDLVVVLGHYIEHVQAVDTAGNIREDECQNKFKALHDISPFLQ